MSRISKQKKAALAKFDKSKSYSLNEAVDIVKQITYTKFDASVDLNIRLGVDPRKANQMVRGSVTLPHGTGKVVRVLVLCNPDKEQEAKEAGADFVGLDEYIQKIKDGWTDVDVIITTPNIMPKVDALGRLNPVGMDIVALKHDATVEEIGGVVGIGNGRKLNVWIGKQLEIA